MHPRIQCETNYGNEQRAVPTIEQQVDVASVDDNALQTSILRVVVETALSFVPSRRQYKPKNTTQRQIETYQNDQGSRERQTYDRAGDERDARRAVARIRNMHARRRQQRLIANNNANVCVMFDILIRFDDETRKANR